jgi:hypothetical protein
VLDPKKVLNDPAFDAPAPNPIAVLLSPTLLLSNEPVPIAVLLNPDVLLLAEFAPNAELFDPVEPIFAKRELEPNAELDKPSVFALRELNPTPVLFLPFMVEIFFIEVVPKEVLVPLTVPDIIYTNLIKLKN